MKVRMKKRRDRAAAIKLLSPPDRKQHTCRVIRLQLEAEEGNDRGRPLLTSGFQQIMRGFTLPSQFPPLSTNQNLIQDSSEEIWKNCPCCLSRAVTVMLGLVGVFSLGSKGR